MSQERKKEHKSELNYLSPEYVSRFLRLVSDTLTTPLKSDAKKMLSDIDYQTYQIELKTSEVNDAKDRKDQKTTDSKDQKTTATTDSNQPPLPLKIRDIVAEFKQDLEFNEPTLLKAGRKTQAQTLRKNLQLKACGRVALCIAHQIEKSKSQYLQKSIEFRDRRYIDYFLTDVEELIREGLFVAAVIKKDDLQKTLSNLRSQCFQWRKELDNALELQIFRVEIPKDIANLCKPYKYDSRLQAGLKAGVVAPLSLLALPFALFGDLGVLAMGGDKSVFIEGALHGITMFAAPFECWGRSLTVDLPGNDFKSKVDVITYDEKTREVKLSHELPNTVSTKSPEDIKKEEHARHDPELKALLEQEEKERKARIETFFVVEGRDPQDIFTRGTHHMLGIEGQTREKLNPHGHVVLFKDLNDAYQFALRRNAAAYYYDPVAGHRLHNPWTKEQLEQVHAKFKPLSDDVAPPKRLGQS